MKFQVQMKDPDQLYDAASEAVNDELKATNLDEEERDAIREMRTEKVTSIADKWFRWGEYLTVEIDTETKTIRVVPVEEQES